MGFFAKRAATEQRLLKRSCESLLGVSLGLLADDCLSDTEIKFLKDWLRDNENIATTWPGELIYQRINEVLKDGKIDEQERLYLKKTLEDMLGGSLQESGASSGLATKLPIDKIDSISIKSKLFCFTGSFLYGTRTLCEKAILDRGGSVGKSITKKLDYLIIGTMSTHSWANTSHGRKIEKAIEYKKQGAEILILEEEQWIQFLD